MAKQDKLKWYQYSVGKVVILAPLLAAGTGELIAHYPETRYASRPLSESLYFDGIYQNPNFRVNGGALISPELGFYVEDPVERDPKNHKYDLTTFDGIKKALDDKRIKKIVNLEKDLDTGKVANLPPTIYCLCKDPVDPKDAPSLDELRRLFYR